MKDIDTMIDFFLYEKGEKIKLNGVDQTTLLIDATDKLTYFNDKIMRCKCQINTGDMVEYNNSKYIIISQIDKDENTFKARIRKCSYRIAFNWLGTVKWFDSIEESKVFDVSSGSFISVASGNIFITMSNNPDTRNIALNNRFYVTNQPFKIVGIDRSQEGLVKFNCALDSISTAYDDVENNIVDRWRYETAHTYSLAINNGDSANVLVNSVFQLNVIATDNGIAIPNPVITFTSSEPEIISVDNSGNIMGISLGQAVITAKMTYRDKVTDSIMVTSVETLTHSYAVGIIGNSVIKVGQTLSYIAKIYDSGVEVFDKAVTWSIRNQDGTTSPAYATITVSTGNGVTIKANTNGNYHNRYTVLKATLTTDPTIFLEFPIQLKSTI